MLLIPCPYCGVERPELEFSYGGEARIARPADPAAASDAEWADYLYFRTNPKGVIAERWRHVFGCGRFFNCLRDTASDRILAVYRAGEARPDLSPPSPTGARA
jgi:sarcosine oxidase subunit delta